ncbi:unnamed protein product [Caenorhabditis sp. 36 PRJEB53466]|nr:unnamed protein product [Caenorhabditis sp. 36 PRJEB53466]
MHFLNFKNELKKELQKINYGYKNSGLDEDTIHQNESNIFDNIYSPLVLFGIFTCIGFFIGYLNFFRANRGRIVARKRPTFY